MGRSVICNKTFKEQKQHSWGIRHSMVIFPVWPSKNLKLSPLTPLALVLDLSGFMQSYYNASQKHTVVRQSNERNGPKKYRKKRKIEKTHRGRTRRQRDSRHRSDHQWRYYYQLSLRLQSHGLKINEQINKYMNT